MRILFTGGGTGGHIFPLIAVTRELKKIYSQSPERKADLEILFLGPGDFTKKLLTEGIKTKKILTGKLRRYFSAQTLLDFLKIPLGLGQALWYIFIWMPDVIFSKGGYGSLPVILAGWLYRIPILIHESDTLPGLANRLAAKLAKRIAISFASTGEHFPPEKTALVGNPIRSGIVQTCLQTNEEDKEKAKNILKIVSQKPIIFIIGGSQGAQKLNEIVSVVLLRLLKKYEIIHQAGSKNYQKISESFNQSSLPNDYHLYSFLDENQMGAAYLLADLVVSRAGAGSISEIAACGKPSILIPLIGAAADHQKRNAFVYAQAGSAVILEQANLTPHLFLNEIAKILDNQELSQRMASQAKKFSRPEAAQKIAQAIIEMAS